MEPYLPAGGRADVEPSLNSATTPSRAPAGEKIQGGTDGRLGTAGHSENVKISPATNGAAGALTYPGKINMSPQLSTRATAGPFFDEAIRAQRHVNTADRVEINIFCDGSYQNQRNRAGYALAWPGNRAAPASTDNHSTTVLAFYMPSAGNNNNAEAAAIAEAHRVAKRELVLVIGSFIEAGPSTALETIVKSPASINIFSDNTSVMMSLKSPHRVKGSALYKGLIQECLSAAHDALKVPKFPGLVVKLSLSWVPAHRPEWKIHLHDSADRAAKEAKTRRECFRLSGSDGKEPPNFSNRVSISPDSGILKALNHLALVPTPPPIPRANVPKKRRRADEDDDDDDDDAPSKPPAKKLKAIRKLKASPKLKAVRKLKAPGTQAKGTQAKGTQTPGTQAAGAPVTRTPATGTHPTAGRAATGSTDAPSSARAAGAPTTGASTASALVSPPDDDPRLARMEIRARFGLEFQNGAAFLSDGISSRLFMTNMGAFIYIYGVPRADVYGVPLAEMERERGERRL